MKQKTRESTKKIIRNAFIASAVAVCIVFANGCWYVFRGQFKSADKLDRGEELSLYECCSIYTMHMAICTVGWLYSPECTMELIGMSFPFNRDKVMSSENEFFLDSPTVKKSLDRAKSDKVRVAFKDKCYALSDADHRVALAANPGYLSVDGGVATLEVPVHYPYCRDTHIGLPWGGEMRMNECLFNYLEGRRWLHPYTVVYKATIL